MIRIICVATFAALINLGSSVEACEDDHPPVIAAPSRSFTLCDPRSAPVISLAFDPRGLGGLMIPNEKRDCWIDSNDPSGVWHYREWQWWKGHPWGDSCRPRYYADVDFARSDSGPGARIKYRIDGFRCSQHFLMPKCVERTAPYWELVTCIQNDSGADVEEYGQFFACYTPLNRGRSFWYWDESDRLVRFADRGVTHLDGYVCHPRAYFLDQSAIPHCPRGNGRIVGRWRRPIMVSPASEGGWRSVILIERQFAAALAHGISGAAMDYILFPGYDQPRFAKDAKFSVHIRHVMLHSPKLPRMEQLEELWSEFEASHDEVHTLAARSR